MRRRPLLPRRRGRRAGVEDDGVDGRRAPGLTNHIPLLSRHSSTAAPGYILRQPQLAAAVAGPVRILPQFESFYTNPSKNAEFLSYLTSSVCYLIAFKLHERFVCKCAK